MREWKAMSCEGDGAIRISACVPWSLTVPEKVRGGGSERVERERW